MRRSWPPCSSCARAPQAAPQPLPHFGHVVVIVFENKGPGAVLGNRNAPAFNGFARAGAVLSGYRGVTNPSLPNYLALVSGSTHGVTTDCTSCVVGGPSLADTLAAKGLTWKAYAEGIPRAGWTGAGAGRYAKKHVPFLYFRHVLARPAWLRIVPLAQLRRLVTAAAAGLRARRPGPLPRHARLLRSRSATRGCGASCRRC